MWYLSSPIRDGTCAPCIRSIVLTTVPPGKSLAGIFFFFFFLIRAVCSSPSCLWIVWMFIMCFIQSLLSGSPWEIAHQELPRFLASENFSLLSEPSLISLYDILPLITSSHVCSPQSWGLADGAQIQIDLKRERKGLGEATSVVSFGAGYESSNSISAIYLLCFQLAHLTSLS